MRYRRLHYRYAMVVRSGQPRPFGELSETDRLRLLVEPRWRPDTYETAATVEILIDLAGVDEDDFEVQLFVEELRRRHESLTPREREVMTRVVAGLLNKQIAVELGTSEITVKVHRAKLVRKMRAKSLPELVRMAGRLGAPAVGER